MNSASAWHKKVEVAANIAIVVVGLLVCGALVKNYFLSGSKKVSSIAPVTAGTKLTLPGVDWQATPQTLLLVLSDGCRFCTESAAFYQELTKQLATRSDIRLIAVFPTDVYRGKEYLNQLGVGAFGEVRQASLATIGVVGTPTLILVDDQGVVVNAWAGKLRAEEEADVFRHLKLQAAERAPMPARDDLRWLISLWVEPTLRDEFG